MPCLRKFHLPGSLGDGTNAYLPLKPGLSFVHCAARGGELFLTRKPGLVPTDLPDKLDAAGLLEYTKGKPRVIRYGREAIRPCGSDGLKPLR